MNKIRIAITSGDQDGIGLEVAAKALNFLGPQKNIQFILWRGSKGSRRYLDLLDQKFKRTTVHDVETALSFHDNSLIDLNSNLSPAHWVERSAELCFDKRLAAMVTGPLSKITIKNCNMKDLGHTDILKRVSKTKKVNMGFVGSEFSVLLATGHLPIAKISKEINLPNLIIALEQAHNLKKCLPKSIQNKPIGVLGLNPHAGESGLIGLEETHVFEQLHKYSKKRKIPIEGPLIPDAAFFRSNWKKYSIYLALYHDQGLIPFKMIHGQDSGVHISMGLPFIRTSVDHGTAKDIFGKNIANPNSMIEAIQIAIKLAKKNLS